MLYALTVVDIRSVGPGVWNDWKSSLLRELYFATEAFLEGKDELEPAAKAAASKLQVKEHLNEGMADRIGPIIDDFEPSYWRSFTITALVRHSRFFDSVAASKMDYGVHTRVHKPDDITELWVLTRDRIGLFADLSGVIASCGAQIVGARLHTGQDNRVMDVFYLQNALGLAFGRVNSHVLENLRRRITHVISGNSADIHVPPSKITRRAAAIPVAPAVKFIEKGVADNQTILEIEGRDRAGLLFAIGNTLLQENISVLSAHIEVVGNKAIDAFYVKGPDGRLSSSMKKRLRQKLLDTLERRAGAKAA